MLSGLKYSSYLTLPKEYISMKNCFTKCSLKVIHLEMSPTKWWAFGSPLQCMDIVTHKHVLTRTHGSASSTAGIQVPTWLPFGIRPAIAPSGLYPSPFTDDAVICWYRRSFKSAMSHLPGRNKINLITMPSITKKWKYADSCCGQERPRCAVSGTL